jgi:hypothetical protein
MAGRVRVSGNQQSGWVHRKDVVSMNRIALLPPLLKNENSSAEDTQEMEITAVVHELKNQACTIGLGIAALKYPDATEDERRRHLAALEAVISAMNRQFHRLDDWLTEAGYKRKPGKPMKAARGRRTKRGRTRRSAADRVV